MTTARRTTAPEPGWRWVAACSATAFVVLTVLVATDVTQGLDDRAVQWFRPDDEWTWRQTILGWVIDFFEPARTLVFLAVLVAIVAVRRRSWRPLGFAAVTMFATTAALAALKVLMARPDPHQDVASSGGSYPSGHVATLVAALGVLVLLQSARSRWWQWLLVAAGGAFMALPMLLGAAHWATDLAGGALLAATVLALASRLPWRGPAVHPRPAPTPARADAGIRRSPALQRSPGTAARARPRRRQRA